MRRAIFCLLALFLFSLICPAQQKEIPQFTAIGGFTYLSTPSLNLVTRGFNGDFAANVRPWMSMGFDFSTSSGDNTVIPKYLNTATQLKLAAMLPTGYPVSAVTVPTGISVQTYQVGPQLNYRHFRHLTLFVRPALGLLHAKIQTHPITGTAPLVSALLGGKLSSSDNVLFYGFGSGMSWEITPHFGLRTSVDLARYNMFSDTLNGARNAVRISVMPKFSFGKNIVRETRIATKD
jgi:hypothetical protein